jgi:hypothetical protein
MFQLGEMSDFAQELKLSIKTTPTCFRIFASAVPKEGHMSTITEYLKKIQHLEWE